MSFFSFSPRTLFCSSSNDFPFVSGSILTANNRWSTMAPAKKAKAMVPPASHSATIGKVQVITAAQNQCTKVPNACPPALTELGNISEIKTQMTAP